MARTTVNHYPISVATLRAHASAFITFSKSCESKPYLAGVATDHVTSSIGPLDEDSINKYADDADTTIVLFTQQDYKHFLDFIDTLKVIHEN